MGTIDIQEIWWRNVQLGEFYNIERYPKIKGGGGSLYIEIPSSLVPQTLEFLEAEPVDPRNMPAITIIAKTIGEPIESGEIVFHRKEGGRMRIANQNRQQKVSNRHPAWTEERGFPRAPDGIVSRHEAEPFFPEGGLRIYIAKTYDGEFYAGFTAGERPKSMKKNDPMWDLYTPNPVVGGLIR